MQKYKITILCVSHNKRLFFYISIIRMGTYLGLCEARIDSLYTIQTNFYLSN